MLTRLEKERRHAACRAPPLLLPVGLSVTLSRACWRTNPALLCPLPSGGSCGGRASRFVHRAGRRMKRYMALRAGCGLYLTVGLPASPFILVSLATRQTPFIATLARVLCATAGKRGAPLPYYKHAVRGRTAAAAYRCLAFRAGSALGCAAICLYALRIWRPLYSPPPGLLSAAAGGVEDVTRIDGGGNIS